MPESSTTREVVSSVLSLIDDCGICSIGMHVQAFNDFLVAWGLWRESHDRRVTVFRKMLDEIERQIKFRTIETEKVSPRGPQVIVDVKNPGLSVSQWLPTVPRGGANYLGRPEVRATYDIEFAFWQVTNSIKEACENSRQMEEALLRGRIATIDDADCTSRGPLAFEASAIDYVRFMATMIKMIDAELDAQIGFVDAVSKRGQTTRPGLARLEALLAVIEVQPYVDTEAVDEIAHIVATSDALAAERTREQGGAEIVRRKSSQRRKKKSQSSRTAGKEQSEGPGG